MPTLLSALEQAISRASAHHQGEVLPPVCLLWPDPEEQWAEAVSRLSQKLPVLTLGKYDPLTRTGPAIWIRMALLNSTAGTVPVVYLPGVRRSQLRGQHPDAALQPLVELQYRGVTFAHPNGKSWTPAAFVQNSTHGLDTEVLLEAHAELRRQLPLLLELELQTLKQQVPITSRWLRALAYPDLGGAVLDWLNAATVPAPAETLAAAVLEVYGVSLSEGPLSVATRLASREGAWQGLWSRFEIQVAHLPGIVQRLRQIGPDMSQTEWTMHEAAVFPQANTAAENALRAALQALIGLSASESRPRLKTLEAEHGERRQQVWARIGQSPLAVALEHLVRLAERTDTTLPGATLTELGAAYAKSGFQADLALIDTLASAQSDADLELLGTVARPLNLAWLEQVNTPFLTLASKGLPRPRSAEWKAEPGLAVLFVDGLRYDLATRLTELLQQAGNTVTLDWQFSALPSITPTAKPAVAPQGGTLEALKPDNLGLGYNGQVSTAQVLRQVLAGRGFAYVEPGAAGDSSGAAWAESGDIDRLGHSEKLRLPRLLGGVFASLQERIQGLLVSGFQEVRVVTDHGWLLMPGGLPKVELPAHLTLFKKGRCALLKAGNSTGFPSVPWTWDSSVMVTVAPGVHAFEAGQIYDHGGVTLQECVVPILTVRAAERAVPEVSISSVRWTGLRCRVEVAGSGLSALSLDLRRKAADPTSSLLPAPKKLDAKGQASLLVEDDRAEGDAAMLVVLDGEKIVRQQLLMIGGQP